MAAAALRARLLGSLASRGGISPPPPPPPGMKVRFATTADSVHHHPKHNSGTRGSGGDSGEKKSIIKADLAPVYVVLGMVMVVVTIGVHTAKQHLVHSPAVQVSKKKRETVSELEDPDRVLNSADKFLSKSFLRKVAHIQEHDRTMPDPIRTDAFAQPRKTETLKSVGVNPRNQ